IDKGLITDEQVLVGRRRTRVYYHITEEGKKYLEEIKMEYQLITEGITNILEYQEEKKCELPNENENNI
ncbi:MAG: helix-turn-helix transcriptional regulator, partial [Ruminococcus sp.]|nr:helix-turn-helix transcriptional regulator [Ruminococcus sp.]